MSAQRSRILPQLQDNLRCFFTTDSWIGRAACLALLSLVSAVPGFSSDSLPPIMANQNHQPAGTLHDGILSLELEIARGEWHPESDDGTSLAVYAFGERGQALQNPGPLIRVPQGTEIRAAVHNALPVAITVHGLADPSGASDASLRVAPGATEHVTFKAANPGLSFYWGASEVDDLKLRYGIDSELTGAIAIDPPGASPRDEIFVMEMMSERAGVGARQTLATINGKSWPYTQRFRYQAGESVHWRWINATNEPHALHLHGSYYRVDAFNRAGLVQTFEANSRPLVVTQRIAQGETFDMSWSPERAGQWLFHCHMLQHMTPAIVPKVPGLSVSTPANQPQHADGHDVMGMGQLVLGITVPEPTPASEVSWHASRKLRLEISERGGAPRYSLQLHDDAHAENAPRQPGLIGPPIILTRGEPVEIDVVNKLKDPTAIHWHGIELESYYDGVPGWSGSNRQITPPIAPGTSFIARMVPPRPGTFIYHTHWHDATQLTNGLYGPLLVLPPGEVFDPSSDLTFVFSIGDFGALHEIALINGTPQNKMLQLQAGKKYRFRFINISTNNQGMQISLRNANGPVEWLTIAKDGADLPAEAVRSSKAQLPITVGETYDVEFSAATPQDLLLDLFLPGQKIHLGQTLSFTSAAMASQ